MELNTITDRPVVVIRPYGHADAADTLAIFLAAVTETAAADYSPEQIQAWARPEARELSTWHTAMQARNSYVATVHGVPAGFSDVDSEGYIDMMFVAPRYLGRGVARQLIGHAEARASQEHLTELTADVSITARPVFERSGFTVEAEQHSMTAGVQLTNFKMKKKLVGGEVSLSGQLVCLTQDQAGTVREHLQLHLALTRAEPGCLSFNVTRTSNPLVWQVEERFEQASAFEAHQERVASSEWGHATAGIERHYSVIGL
ncbi:MULTISPECIES: GNAT family N-acetyltransferase [unclassified Cryobacterium]|uniref:GNAT family N-acetyltransferase n=1 Tax=unclassified Cryobacterium TaxID=2649013 RepID=UPI002AB56F5B|nr:MULTISPECIES: GNAT family N-acetyltransferase [unclassified Cryobacterium]MDY7529240.1 GNAT family N-acetyltransferase [Cryobacterium sp. 10C2]MDY7558598.1 GNAT family N-acetyltransferase [Cryobacterium sp. 10C3]MEB0289719.1 GNAT family N-acetyltransferase [Cryobacterium sp. 10C2]MEB0304140.1 GNAT family N-acetyltransferase [Cryobacterium sp. 10I1]